MNKDEALKMAIEALEDMATVHANLEPIINACKEALEQPAQEPVAWMAKDEEHIIPLYTHPHQWQGLTDDEIVAKVFENDELLARILYLDGVSKALKQALEEKNHGI